MHKECVGTCADPAAHMSHGAGATCWDDASRASRRVTWDRWRAWGRRKPQGAGTQVLFGTERRRKT